MINLKFVIFFGRPVVILYSCLINGSGSIMLYDFCRRCGLCVASAQFYLNGNVLKCDKYKMSSYYSFVWPCDRASRAQECEQFGVAIFR